MEVEGAWSWFRKLVHFFPFFINIHIQECAHFSAAEHDKGKRFQWWILVCVCKFHACEVGLIARETEVLLFLHKQLQSRERQCECPSLARASRHDWRDLAVNLWPFFWGLIMAFVPLGPGWKPRNECQQDFNISFSLREGWVWMKSRFKSVATELPSKAFIHSSVLRERKHKQAIWLVCGYRRIHLWIFGTHYFSPLHWNCC